MKFWQKQKQHSDGEQLPAEPKATTPAEKTVSPPEASNPIVSKLTGWVTVLRRNQSNLLRLVTVALTVLVLFVVIQLVRSRNTYAVVDGHVISKQEFKEAQQAYTNLSQKTADSSLKIKDVKAYTRNQLILDAALQNAASKAGIKISQSDIDKQLFVISLKDGKVAQGRAGYKKELGWSERDIDREGRIKVLQNMLSSRLLQYINLLRVVAYFTKSNDKATAKQTLEKRAEPWFAAHKTIYEILAASDDASARAGAYSPTQILASNMSVSGLNEISELERAAVSKLKQAGDYTPVTLGDGRLYFIDRLEAKSSGNYKNWDDFSNSAVAHATILKSIWDLHRLTLGLH